jgi:hypothetical protein
LRIQKLKELLGTGYIVAFYKGYKKNDYIGIGTGYVHDIIHLDCVTLKVSYSMDRKEEDLSFQELKDASKNLKKLIASGEIQDIISGDDDPEINNIPVFYEENGDIKQTFCAELGYPHTTITGELMYENSYYPTGREAAESSYSSEESHIRELARIDDMIKDFHEKIEAQKKWKQEAIDHRRKLKEYLGL